VAAPAVQAVGVLSRTSRYTIQLAKARTCCLFCIIVYVTCLFVGRYEAALALLQEEQRAIDRRVASGGFRNKERDSALQVGLVLQAADAHLA